MGHENDQLSNRSFKAEAVVDQARASATWQQCALQAELEQLRQVARDRLSLSQLSHCYNT